MVYLNILTIMSKRSVEDRYSSEIKTLIKINNEYPKDVSEFLFKVFTILQYPHMISKINFIIHILGNNHPWFRLQLALTELDEMYTLHTESEDQQEYDESEERNLRKYDRALNDYMDYINTGTVIKREIGDISIKKIPILIVYLYYIELRIAGLLNYNTKIANRLIDKMIEDLPIKFYLFKENSDFLLDIFEYPGKMKIFYKL